MLTFTKNDSRAIIRPLEQAWSPVYQEDTSFEACAPASSQPLRAPIHHFKSTTGEASYCEEIYPTKQLGLSAPQDLSTAHFQVWSMPHSSDGQYPLLAFKDDIESALQNNPSYSCQATFPSSVASTASKTYPASGACCNGASAAGFSHQTSCGNP